MDPRLRGNNQEVTAGTGGEDSPPPRGTTEEEVGMGPRLREEGMDGFPPPREQPGGEDGFPPPRECWKGWIPASAGTTRIPASAGMPVGMRG